eukprot:2078112-Rhodomonas_salina.2
MEAKRGSGLQDGYSFPMPSDEEITDFVLSSGGGERKHSREEEYVAHMRGARTRHTHTQDGGEEGVLHSK